MKCSVRRLLTCNTKVQLHIVSFNIFFENDFLEFSYSNLSNQLLLLGILKFKFIRSRQYLAHHTNLNQPLKKVVVMAVWLLPPPSHQLSNLETGINLSHRSFSPHLRALHCTHWHVHSSAIRMAPHHWARQIRKFFCCCWMHGARRLVVCGKQRSSFGAGA